MNIVMKSAAAAAVAISFAGIASAQSATGNATVQIVDNLQLTADSDLAFGLIVADPDAAGTYVLDAVADEKTPSNNITAVTGTSSFAEWTVNGVGANGVTISFPADQEIVLAPAVNTGMATADRPRVSDFNHNAASNLTDGSMQFLVGGTLSINADQAVDTYTGTYTVLAEYN
ncbi:MAG: DUF4402 domain-containing protein [Pseudomonadota bacterium]